MSNRTKGIFISLGCFVLIGALIGISVLLFQISKEPFVYNTRGYINDTKSCDVLRNTNGPSAVLVGNITVSFYGIESDDNDTLITQIVVPPGICLSELNPCCSHWVGKLLYFQVAEPSLHTYYVNDMSASIVQQYGVKLGFAIVFACVAFIMLILYGFVMWCNVISTNEYVRVPLE